MLGNRGNSLWSLGGPRCRVFHSKEQKLIEFPPRTGLIDPAHDSSGTLSGGVGRHAVATNLDFLPLSAQGKVAGALGPPRGHTAFQ